eukprot:13697754-Ditylum_brightwellii.AAC.1
MAGRGAVEGMNEIQEKIEKLGMTTGEGDGVEIEGFAWMLCDEVVADNIANAVAVWTGIPSQKMLKSESN